MLKFLRIAGVVAVVVLLAAPMWAQPANVSVAPATPVLSSSRDAVVDELIARWGGVLPQEGRDQNVAAVRASLSRMTDEELARLEKATTWEEVQPKLFGDIDTDLVFTPLAGCRLLDTRAGTVAPYNAPVPPNTTIQFSVNDSTAQQGGSATFCDPDGLGLDFDPPALAIVISAISPTGPGNLRTFPGEGVAPVPLAAMLTYTAGVTISTGVITQSCATGGCSDELAVRNQGAGTTHIAIDLVGFFHRPNRTALVCSTVSATNTIAATTSWNFTSAACPANTTLTGGGVNWFNNSTNVWWWQNSPNTAGTAWQTRGYNANGSSVDITAYGRCCQTAGR